MENGLSASDVALMSRNNDGGFGFGGDGAWIFGLLVLLGLFNGGFGGFGGNRGDRNATVGDVQRATDFAALERQNNEGVAATRQSAYDVMTAIKDGNFNVLGELRDIQSGVNADFANQHEMLLARRCVRLTVSITTELSTRRLSMRPPRHRPKRFWMRSPETEWQICRTKSTSYSYRRLCAAFRARLRMVMRSCRTLPVTAAVMAARRSSITSRRFAYI